MADTCISPTEAAILITIPAVDCTEYYLQTDGMMEVVAGGERPGAPFTRRNVQEWSKLDRLTGLLEHARVETDHWTASTSSSSHHFGKVRPHLMSPSVSDGLIR